MNTGAKWDVIQIGSHIGATAHDPIFAQINNETRAIFVEPVPYLFEQLVSNYLSRLPGNKNLVFINKACSNQSGTLQLYVPSERNDFSKLPPQATQLSSVNKYHVRDHRLEMEIEVLTVEAVTLNDIIREYGVEQLDLLQIDTEGHDYEILMALDFDLLRPRRIMFEHRHLDGAFKHGTRLDELLAHLQLHGYRVSARSEEDILLVLT